jgi:putative NIF3 family GTP cyclohydrolase 1 type 2
MKTSDLIRVCNEEIPESVSWSQGEYYGAYNIDNYGATVTKVLYCVTPTKAVQRYFKENGYDLLISHHPYMTDLPQLIYHTALDCCEGGLNDMWRDHLELQAPYKHFDGTLGWHGEIKPILFSELVAKSARLSGKIIGETFSAFGPDALIKTVVICSGLGGMVNAQALATEADCYIIGQNVMAGNETGFRAVIETGHTASEWIGVNLFKRILAGVQVDLAPEALDVYGQEYNRPMPRTYPGYGSL